LVKDPVPPAVIGKVPVVRALVLDAYTAPPLEKEVNPVPPLVVAIVPPFQVPAVIVPTVAISVPTNLLASILPASMVLVTLLVPIVVTSPVVVTSPESAPAV
jgi:hypothetical protein